VYPFCVAHGSHEIVEFPADFFCAYHTDLESE
jgi:hypothetical protein